VKAQVVNQAKEEVKKQLTGDGKSAEQLAKEAEQKAKDVENKAKEGLKGLFKKK
jgi:hypothetical protein